MKERLSSQRVYEGIVIDVDVDEVLLPNGVTTRLEVIRHPGAATVLPIHPDRTVTLVRQFRYAAAGTIYEVPAGKLDGGESPESCALREVQEEVGLKTSRLHPMGFIFTTPGFTDEKIHLFAATELEPCPQALEEDEIIEAVRMPLDDAMALAERGEIQDGKSLCTLFRLEQDLRNGRLTL